MIKKVLFVAISAMVLMSGDAVMAESQLGEKLLQRDDTKHPTQKYDVNQGVKPTSQTRDIDGKFSKDKPTVTENLVDFEPAKESRTVDGNFNENVVDNKTEEPRLQWPKEEAGPDSIKCPDKSKECTKDKSQECTREMKKACEKDCTKPCCKDKKRAEPVKAGQTGSVKGWVVSIDAAGITIVDDAKNNQTFKIEKATKFIDATKGSGLVAASEIAVNERVRVDANGDVARQVVQLITDLKK